MVNRTLAFDPVERFVERSGGGGPGRGRRWTGRHPGDRARSSSKTSRRGPQLAVRGQQVADHRLDLGAHRLNLPCRVACPDALIAVKTFEHVLRSDSSRLSMRAIADRQLETMGQGHATSPGG